MIFVPVNKVLMFKHNQLLKQEFILRCSIFSFCIKRIDLPVCHVGLFGTLVHLLSFSTIQLIFTHTQKKKKEKEKSK